VTVSDIAIVVDSTADLPETCIASDSVETVALRISWGDEVLRDRVDISTSDFYARLRTGAVLPKSSAPPIGEFEETYTELLQTHSGIISIHLPSGLSSTYSVATAAARQVAPEKIRVVEGGHCSLGLGWLAERALSMGGDGADLDTIVSDFTALVPRVRLYAALDTLEFLQRGGRIGRVAALAGALLQVKPILQIHDGQVLPVERVRTRAAAVRRLAEIAVEAGPLARLAVLHGDAAQTADELALRLTTMLPEVSIERGEISPVVGVHAGPGVIGLTWITSAS
jgi:DegV family protein with EDD domain